MEVKGTKEVLINNISGGALWLELSDGRSVALSPRVCPVAIPKRELDANTSLKKLIDLRVVKVIHEAEKGAEKKTIELGPEPEVAPKASVKEESKAEKKGEPTGKGKK